MSTETHVHYVTVAASGDDGPAYVTFVCLADPTARCRNYPDCGCEVWDTDGEDDGTNGPWKHTHPSVPQPKCWLQEWFANDGTDYEGEDTLDGQPTRPHHGPIEAYFEGDYVSWNFIEKEINR